VPVLLQHGADDPYAAVAGTRRFFERVDHPDKKLRIYPGCRHEVHNDAGRLEFERDLVGWIADRAGSGPAAAAVPPAATGGAGDAAARPSGGAADAAGAGATQGGLHAAPPAGNTR
jgi:fermentation-respiration switch protein FrsA (DUF1100 family)